MRLALSSIFISFFYCATASSANENVAIALDKADKVSVLNHLETLSSDEFAGRKFSSEESLITQSYLINALKKLKVSAFKGNYRHSFEQISFFSHKNGANIIGYIPGSQFPQQYIVLTAHYDHLGSKQNKVFNGADDNASGTAALLHYAKVIEQNPLKHSVIILFTDGEEADLLGAKAFVNEQKDLLVDIKLNVNLDMIAGSVSTKRLRFISRDLAQVISPEKLQKLSHLQASLKANSTTTLTAGFRNMRSAGSNIFRTNWRMASDHGAFSKAGIPFIYFGVGAHKNYHSVRDDFNGINQALFLASIDVIFQQLIFLDTAIAETSISLSPCK